MISAEIVVNTTLGVAIVNLLDNLGSSILFNSAPTRTKSMKVVIGGGLFEIWGS